MKFTALYKILMALTLMVLSSSALAHELKPSIVNMSVENDQVKSTTLMVNLESLIAGIEPEHENTDDSANSERYDALRRLSSAELTQEFSEFRNTLESFIRIYLDDDTLVPVTVDVDVIPPVGDTRIARDSLLSIEMALPPNVSSFRWQSDPGLGDVILRVGSGGTVLDHAELISRGGTSDPVVLGVPSEASLSRVLIDYVQSGFVHIIPRGLDHILFVIGIFLLSPAWRPLLWQVSVFTIAHSITLILGTTGVIQVAAHWVEPLIAASIVWLCIENIVSRELKRRRLLVVFAFGLLHGLGFASVLSEVGLSTTHYVAALLAFNVGVELGQILIVALCLLLIASWAADKSWYRTRVIIPGSLLIGFVGVFWVLERLQIV